MLDGARSRRNQPRRKVFNIEMLRIEPTASWLVVKHADYSANVEIIIIIIIIII